MSAKLKTEFKFEMFGESLREMLLFKYFYTSINDDGEPLWAGVKIIGGILGKANWKCQYLVKIISEIFTEKLLEISVQKCGQ